MGLDLMDGRTLVVKMYSWVRLNLLTIDSLFSDSYFNAVACGAAW